jgi:hypothetical protein
MKEKVKYRIKVEVTYPNKYVWFHVETKEHWYEKWKSWGGMQDGDKAMRYLKKVLLRMSNDSALIKKNNFFFDNLWETKS